jgi:hypothetical protein
MTKNSDLDRLLRAAAAPLNEEAAEVPFGFETRVVALWHAQRSTFAREGRELTSLFRRIATAALVVTAFASTAAYWQLQQNTELGEPLDNAYAIADNAIETGVGQ